MARTLGLDIEPTALRATLISSSFRKATIERYLQVPLTIVEPGAPRRAELSEALASLMQSLGNHPDTVIAAVPGDMVSLRIVELPASVAKRIGDVLPLELEALLPVGAEHTVADWQPVRTEGDKILVLAASALRERVSEQLQDLRAVSIEPRELAAGAALYDGLAILLPDLRVGTQLILDLGDKHTDLCVLDRGKCAFARTLTVGLDLLPQRAEDLTRAIHQTIAAYRATGGPELTQVSLCGAGANMNGAVEWLAAQLAMPVHVIALPEAPNASFDKPLFARSAALAARGIATEKHINLRTGPFALTRSVGALRAHVGLMGVCAVAVLLSLAFSVQARRSLLEEERNALQAELTRTTTEIFGKPLGDADAIQAMLKNPRAGDPLPHFDAFDVIGAVSQAVPAEIKHDIRRLRIEIGDDKREGRLELQGALSSIEERDAVVAKLEQHDCIHDIERGRTTPARGEESINYQIEAVIRCSGDPAPKKNNKKSSE